MDLSSDWYKKNEIDTIWWLWRDEFSAPSFSFDKKTIFNVYKDYPHNLTKEQKAIFDRENPYWKDFFKDRQ